MNDTTKKILDKYCAEKCLDGMSSQDIADELRETLKMEVNEITEHLLDKGYRLRYDDSRLVWSDKDL